MQQRIKDVVAVILGGGRGERLWPLTRDRSKPAVPIAGKYRLIDIPVSNCINSGIRRMFVVTQFNSTSLHRHIGLSYKFDNFSRGYVEILAAQQTPTSDRWFQGTADAVRQNIQLIKEARGDLAIVLSGDHLYRMDYRQMLRDHEENEADITLAVLPCSEQEIAAFGAVRVDDSGRVVEFREKPKNAAAREGMQVAPSLLEARGVDADRPYLASMGIYIFSKPVLECCLDNDLLDFGHHVIPAAVERFRVQAHFFTGYWRDIGTIRSFYDCHLDLVQPEPPIQFNDPDWPFFTHPNYPPAARLQGVRANRTLLADGVEAHASTIEDSVIGLRARLRKATVRRSYIVGADPYPPPGPSGAPPIGIGEGSLVQDAIVDRNARIGRKVRIINRDRVKEAAGNGWVIREGIVVIPRDAVLPDGITI